MITGVAVLSKGPILSTVLLIRVVNLSDWPVNWLFIELKTVKSGSSEKSSFQASIYIVGWLLVIVLARRFVK
jgi:hypothetical protein